MSLSTALSNALTGLNAAARGADVVSSNVANARTPAYARRELDLSSQSLGGQGAGVTVDGIARTVNMPVLTDRRLADSALADSGTRADALATIERAIGLPGEAGALGDLFAGLSSALITAASRPDSQARLQGVLDAAVAVAGKMNDMSRSLQAARSDADRTIASDADHLNQTLSAIDRINADILAARSAQQDANALMDQRQRLVDQVASIVPVREVARDRGQIALYTAGGAILLDGNPAIIGFRPTGTISADMTLGAGDLSGLTINGISVATGAKGPLTGGHLGAAFAIRDEIMPEAQGQIDALARNLIERFQSPALDPSLPAGAAGLFTDHGNPLDPTVEAGLSGRIAINAGVDPGRNGALWHLRDGLGATTPGIAGDATLLQGMIGALSAQLAPGSGNFIGMRSAAGLASDILSGIAMQRQQADSRQTYDAARQSALSELEQQDGVDTDAEMADLLQIEQAYSANARMIQTIDDLIQKLIGL